MGLDLNMSIWPARRGHRVTRARRPCRRARGARSAPRPWRPGPWPTWFVRRTGSHGLRQRDRREAAPAASGRGNPRDGPGTTPDHRDACRTWRGRERPDIEILDPFAPSTKWRAAPWRSRRSAERPALSAFRENNPDSASAARMARRLRSDISMRASDRTVPAGIGKGSHADPGRPDLLILDASADGCR
jgi:hypothetical protein